MSSIELLRSRYGQAFYLGTEINTCIATLLSHRSVRAYRSDPLPSNALELMIAAAQSAATSSNLQTWSVVAVEDPQRKAKLSELAGNQVYIRQCPVFLVWLADLARLAHVAECRGMSHTGLDHLEMFVTATVDAALAAQNANVAAESLGLGTVYIGAMRNHPEQVAATLNLPAHVFAVFGMCVGYPDADTPTAIKPRLPQSAVLHRETYNLTIQDTAIAHYNEIMQAFYREHQMNVAGDWVEHSVKRITTPQSLSGRDRLRAALQNLGFELR